MIPEGALSLPEGLASAVDTDAYARLLGYPPGEIGGERVTALAAESRAWFERRGRPWSYARVLEIAEITAAQVTLENRETFTSARLAGLLATAEADRIVVAAVSAGADVDAESDRRWRDDRPDEAFFLDRFGAAVAVHLAAWVGATLRSAAADARLGLAPGYSPGYDGWELAEQTGVARCLADVAPLPGPFDVLSSGMIEPKNSLLAVFGLSERRTAADALWQRHRCSWCSMAGCGLRG